MRRSNLSIFVLTWFLLARRSLREFGSMAPASSRRQYLWKITDRTRPRTFGCTKVTIESVDATCGNGEEESGLLTPPETPTPSNENAPFVSLQDSSSRVVQEPQHELLICAMHFLGDGMALHNFANEFFGLLGSDKDETSLREILDEEWTLRWADGKINDVSVRYFSFHYHPEPGYDRS